MDSFFTNVGMLAIAFLIVYIYKKAIEWYDIGYSAFYEDERVYKAADAFIHGASPDDIKDVVKDCCEFNETDMEKILSASIPHKTDKDGDYSILVSLENIIHINYTNAFKHKVGGY